MKLMKGDEKNVCSGKCNLNCEICMRGNLNDRDSTLPLGAQLKLLVT
jgi:hypothetical protein